MARPEAFRGSHRVRLEVGLEHRPLRVVDALGLLEEARHEVREEGLEVDGRHVEHARSDLLPQLAGQIVFNNVALVRQGLRGLKQYRDRLKSMQQVA